MDLRHALWLPLCVAACNGGDDATDDTDTDDTDVAVETTLAGVWQSTGGDVFAGRGLGDVTFLDLQGDGDAGFAVVHAREADTRALACPQEVWASGPGGTLLLSGQGGEGAGTSDVFLVSQPDVDTLQLTDALGRSQTFTRADAVAAEATCGAVTVTSETTFVIDDDGWTNLLWDGARLLTGVRNDGVVPLNLATGEAGDPIDYGSSYEYLQTMQGTDGWGHCACGGSESIARTSPGGAQVDLVNTDSDLGVRLNVDGAAIDDGKLIISGYSYEDSATHLLWVDADAEPDALITDLVSPLAGNAIATLGDRLLTVSDQRIVEIGDDGLAAATWQLPPAYGDTWWRQITTDGTSVFLGGQASDGSGLLVLKLTLQ